MPKPRKKANQGLPLRWRLIKGTYYYDVPRGLEHMWDNKKLFQLGAQLHEASHIWTQRMTQVDGEKDVKNIGQLLDRYQREVIPTKSPASQSSNCQQRM